MVDPQAVRRTCWSYLCDVDIGPLAAWLPKAAWPVVKGGQPNRVPAPPEAGAVIRGVLECFGVPVTYDARYACVSRIVPGRGHGYHLDGQREEWITRVHVPVITNPEAWFMWLPQDGTKVHFEAGKAYSFNTLVEHAFGNDGDSERVHLTFDVLEALTCR